MYTAYMLIQGRTTVISGASKGIGAAVAHALAEKGARVFSLDIAKPENLHANITHIHTDVTSEEEVQKALGHIPSIDILMLNAGAMRRGKITETTEQEFDLLVHVALKGSWLLLKHAQPLLHSSATIIQMLSRYALDLPIDPGIYGATKKMQLALIELMQKTFPQYDYKFLFPGPTDTNLSRHGIEGDALTKKKEIMCDPGDIAVLVTTLLEEGKQKLLYDQSARKHYIE